MTSKTKEEWKFRLKFDDDAVREIAEQAGADERSVWKRLAGGIVRGRVAKRIDAAISLYLSKI